jgi:hypothetical protein
MVWIYLAPGGAHSKESSGSIKCCLLSGCEHCWIIKKELRTVQLVVLHIGKLGHDGPVLGKFMNWSNQGGERNWGQKNEKMYKTCRRKS